MRLITLVLLVVIVLAHWNRLEDILGWSDSWCDRVIDVVTAFAKVTQGTRDIANNPNFVMTD